jgi:uncharacterized protein (TIGR00255 family)
MSLSSMTGFARSEGDINGVSWVWEIKSVNGKGLDVRCRLPGGYDRLESDTRAQAQKMFARGNVSINLSINQQATESGLQINWVVLDQIIDAVPQVAAKCPTATPPSIDGLLGLRGVLETADDDLDDEGQAEIDSAIRQGLHTALVGLLENRREEGARLTEILSTQVATINDLRAQALGQATVQTDLIRERILNGVAKLLDSSPPLTEDRLAQEAAVLLTKGDVTEELDRLQAHCEAAADLLTEDGAVGRKFDFLCQEFNREANTLCSKAIAPELTQVGLELKVVVDQLREQIQNVE